MYVSSSVSSLYNYQREGISNECVLKRYALLYDKIIFNRFGSPIGDGELAENLAEFISIQMGNNKTIGERKKLAKNKGFSQIFVDCWDFVDNPEAFELDKYRTLDEKTCDRISKFCFAEVRRIQELPESSYEFDLDSVKELSGDIYVDISLNLMLKKTVDLVPSYSPIIGRAIANETESIGLPCHDLFTDELLVPDFDELSWDDIIDLRNDKYIKAFRDVVFEVSSDEKGMDKPLLSRVQKDLWRLVSDSKPSIGKALIGGFLGNLPSPVIVNPIGVGLAIKDSNSRLAKKCSTISCLKN